MGFLGHRNKPKKLNSKIIISFGEAMKYAQNPDYAKYEFVPVDENDLKKGFQPQSKEEIRERIDTIKRRKLNPSFEQSVIAGGIYKYINTSTQPKYNNYQNTKGYKKSTRGIERV